MIYRYREELNAGHEIRTAIAITTATAGRAIFFWVNRSSWAPWSFILQEYRHTINWNWRNIGS